MRFSGDQEKVQAFIKDLKSVLGKHGVWMDAASDEKGREYINFTCELNKSEIAWTCETNDLWP